MNSEEILKRYYGENAHLDYGDETLYDKVLESKSKYGTFTAYDFMGKSVNYNDFLSEIDQCAKALKGMGVKVGDSVTVCLPNVPQLRFSSSHLLHLYQR